MAVCNRQLLRKNGSLHAKDAKAVANRFLITLVYYFVPHLPTPPPASPPQFVVLFIAPYFPISVLYSVISCMNLKNDDIKLVRLRLETGGSQRFGLLFELRL